VEVKKKSEPLHSFTRKGQQMNIKHYGLAIGLTLIVTGSAIGLAWSGASAQREAVSASAYTSYASSEFFFPPYSSDTDRMGIGGAIDMYNPVLRAGWYTDWGTNSQPAHPGGMEYVRTVSFKVNAGYFWCANTNRHIPAWQRSQVTESITGTALIDNLRANPGALWLIGNEPDSIYNGSPIMPELYAELYHEFYTFIKVHDPSARVAIGAVLQPSPLRLEYLDKVLNRYQSLYGEKLPTALWNIHLYAFHEAVCESGAGTPPGASHNGWSYDWWMWSDANLAAQHLRDMRQWMADRGERDKPLIVTEFGQLIPDNGSYCYGTPLVCITPETSRTTLQNDVNYFLTLIDAQTGYPADGNRLLQMWAWFSLHYPQYGGDLVQTNPPTLTLTLTGEAFAQLTSQHFVPYVDLYPVPLITPTLPAASGVPISVSLVAQLDNRGNTLARSVPVRFAQYDYVSGQLLASDLITVSQVFTRYAGIQPQVSHNWLLTSATAYTLAFEIDPAQTIPQARRSEQRLAYQVTWVPDLAITSFTSDLSPAFLWDGPITGTVTAMIRNMGNLASSASTLHFSGLDLTDGLDSFAQDAPIPTLPPGDSVGITISLVVLSPGMHVVTAAVEYAGPDLNLQNDTATFDVFAAGEQVYLPFMFRTAP
jgi:hypothetical protein